MEYSPKLAFWCHYVQAQERLCSQNDGYQRTLTDRDFAPSHGKSSETLIDEIPDYARRKFVEAGKQLRQGEIARALEFDFQALEICSFTLGSNHPSVGVLMHHIATICEAHGLELEAGSMRRTALAIFCEDLAAYGEEYGSYYQ